MKLIETNTPINKPLIARTFYPGGSVPYKALLSSFTVKDCSIDSIIRVEWGEAVLDRKPHVELSTIDPRYVGIITSDAYRKQIVHSLGEENAVSVTSPVNYFVILPVSIGLQTGQAVADFQIFAITDDRTAAYELAKNYISAIATCGHKRAAEQPASHRATATPSSHELERQALAALALQMKDSEAETVHDGEIYSKLSNAAMERAAADRAARDAAIAKAQQALQEVQAAQAEKLRLWQERVDDLTEQVRVAEQDAADKEQIAAQADQLKQQSDSTTDTSAANGGSLGTAGVLMGSLGSIWGSHTAKKNRDAAERARAHANELRAELDDMGASQPPPITNSEQLPSTMADTSNPIQDELNKGLKNINDAYDQDTALKAQQQSGKSAYGVSAASTAGDSTTSDSGADYSCNGHHPVVNGCRGAISDAVAKMHYCYCPK